MPSSRFRSVAMHKPLHVCKYLCFHRSPTASCTVPVVPVSLSNATVNINENGKFLTTAIKVNAMPKSVSFFIIIQEPLENHSVNNFNISEDIEKSQRKEIKG